MHDGYKTTGMRRQWMVLLGLLVALLVMSAVPGYAGRGGHGGGHGGRGGGHSGHGFGHGGHRFGHGGPGFIGPRLGVSIWPYWNSYWGPYWGPYDVPPVVVAPPPRSTSNLPRLPGTIATTPRAIIHMCNSAPAAGARSPRPRLRAGYYACL